MKQQRPLPIHIFNDAAVTVADDSDGAPFLGTPYASIQPFDYPFPVNCLPPDPLLGPQKPSSALPIASSLVSASSLAQPSSDPFASLPSVTSSLVGNLTLKRRAGSTSTDHAVLRHSHSNSSLISARSTKSRQSQGSQGSGSSSPSSSNSSPNRAHLQMTPATAPSLEPPPVGATPRRPKALTLSTNQASKPSANPVSSGSSHFSGLSSLSITSMVDDKHIPPTLRSKLQRTGALVVTSHDALPKSAGTSAHGMAQLKVHNPPAQSATLRPAPLPLLKRPIPARAYSHASSFLRTAPGPIQESAESVEATPPPSAPESTRVSRQSSMKRVIKKTTSLMELGLEGLKRAASGKSSASSKRSRTRAGSRTKDTTEASGDSGRMVMIGPLETPNVINEEGDSSQNLKHEI